MPRKRYRNEFQITALDFLFVCHGDIHPKRIRKILRFSIPISGSSLPVQLIHGRPG